MEDSRREASGPGGDDLRMAPEEMLDLARRAAELLVERIEKLPGEGAWDGDFQQELEKQLLEAPPEEGRPAMDVLERAFGIHHDVLQDTIWGANHPNVSDRGLQLSRSFRALKIWMSVQTFGMFAFRRAVSKGMELAERAEEYVRESPHLEMLTPVSLGIVCFRVNPGDAGLEERTLEEVNRTVLARIFWDDRAFFSSTLLKGKFALRFCIINHNTTWDDVRETLEVIERFGREELDKG